MTEPTANFALLILSVVVTLVNTVIIATTRAAVAELKAELIEKLATKGEMSALDHRLRRLEDKKW